MLACEGRSCIPLSQLASMQGSLLTPGYTTFAWSVQISRPVDGGVQKHGLLALTWHLSEGAIPAPELLVDHGS